MPCDNHRVLFALRAERSRELAEADSLGQLRFRGAAILRFLYERAINNVARVRELEKTRDVPPKRRIRTCSGVLRHSGWRFRG